MSGWPVQDAKARFSELLDASVEKGPQIVTRRGVETAVLVPVEEWRRLNAVAPPVLRRCCSRPTLDSRIRFNPRRKFRRRPPVEFE
jgi:antitoxin Phd